MKIKFGCYLIHPEFNPESPNTREIRFDTPDNISFKQLNMALKEIEKCFTINENKYCYYEIEIDDGDQK